MPLLAVVPARSITEGSAYTQGSTFREVARKEFDRLDFSIKDFSDKFVSFKDGSTVIQIHFRQKLKLNVEWKTTIYQNTTFLHSFICSC